MEAVVPNARKSMTWLLALAVVLIAATSVLWWFHRDRKPPPATTTAHPWHSNDTYQLMLDQDDAHPGLGVARMAANLTHYHEKVAGAEDDPAWARPMEQHMRAAIMADPMAEKLQLASVACRKSGCEVQLFETYSSASLKDITPWFQAIERIRKSQLGAAIELDANFGSRDGNRIMYMTTFKRKTNSPAPPG